MSSKIEAVTMSEMNKMISIVLLMISWHDDYRVAEMVRISGRKTKDANRKIRKTEIIYTRSHIDTHTSYSL